MIYRVVIKSSLWPRMLLWKSIDTKKVWVYPYNFRMKFSILDLIHGRRKVHDYFLLLLCKSSIWFTEKHIFKIIIYFFNTSKCATNYVISFEVYDGFIGQKILKLWRQESRPFGPGWAANIPRIRWWTFRLPWSCRFRYKIPLPILSLLLKLYLFLT